MRLTNAEWKALLARRAGVRGAVVRVLTGRRWEEEFAWQMDQDRVSYLREFRFLADRRFRFDFALLPQMVAVEIDGAVHRIRSRFEGDREKGNLALLAGWRVMHFSPAQVRSGEALTLLHLALSGANNAMQTPALDSREVEA